MKLKVPENIKDLYGDFSQEIAELFDPKKPQNFKEYVAEVRKMAIENPRVLDDLYMITWIAIGLVGQIRFDKAFPFQTFVNGEVGLEKIKKWITASTDGLKVFTALDGHPSLETIIKLLAIHAGSKKEVM